VVLTANDAANKMIMNSPGGLEGRSIGANLPVFAEVLKTEVRREGLRTATQCQGRRDNDEIFAAHTWFSSYLSPAGNRLAAIVVDSSDELRAREEQGLRELLAGNRIIAAAFSHEVRNFCVAMNLLCANMQERSASSAADLHAMSNLIAGMAAVPSTHLRSRAPEILEDVVLRDVLDNLRIVVESQWAAQEVRSRGSFRRRFRRFSRNRTACFRYS
jgi:two-component system sensor kinase FixL